MSEYLDINSNMQRQSTVGDVIYVHFSPRSRRPAIEEAPIALADPVERPVEPVGEIELPTEPLAAVASSEPEPLRMEMAEEPELVEEPPVVEAPTPEPAPAPAPPPVTVGGWPFRVAPQGYAVEFGTGRLVPIVYAGTHH